MADLCPRMVENFVPMEPFEYLNRPDDGTCDYCGSLKGDELMARLEKGEVELGPTDKNYKCQPAGTMVLVVTEKSCGSRPPRHEHVPIELLKPGHQVVTYDSRNCNFCTNGRDVKRVGSRRHDGRLIRVETSHGSSLYTPEHICVVRIARGLSDPYHVYLMRRGNSYRIGRGCGWNDAQKSPGFLYRANREKGDAAWILTTHADSRSAAMMENWLQWKYRIPGMTFVETNHSTAMDQSSLDWFWNEVGDLQEAAAQILEDYGRDVRFPIWSKHSGEAFWRKRCLLMRAANLMNGMELVGYKNEESLPIKVSDVPYSGTVYSLEVDKEQTYVADGLVTHNCYLRVLSGPLFRQSYRTDRPSKPGEVMKDPNDQKHWTWETREMRDGKFYFQHLTPEQQKRFVEMLNAKQLKIGYPGHFYRLPFFVQLLESGD